MPRCGYCLDRIDGALWSCRSCGSTLHFSCHNEFGSCVTFACRDHRRLRRSQIETAKRATTTERSGSYEAIRLCFEPIVSAVAPLLYFLTFLCALFIPLIMLLRPFLAFVQSLISDPAAFVFIFAFSLGLTGIFSLYVSFVLTKRWLDFLRARAAS
jgi:hypothetical protein